MNQRIQHLKKSGLLSTLPPTALHQIAQETEERSYRRRQIIYFAEQKNDYIFLLISGRVKLLRVGANGREVTLDIVSPGELFGEANMLQLNFPYGSSAEVLEDSVVYALRRTSVSGSMINNMDAVREFAALQVRRRHAAEQRLSEFVFFDVPTRLAHLLGRLASFYTNKEGDEESVPIRAKLTHQELANLVGSTRETTTLILNEFKKRKLIEFQGRKIIALDPGGLANFDSHSGSKLPPAADDPGEIGGRHSSADGELDDEDGEEGRDGTRPTVSAAPARRRGRPRTIKRDE